MTYSKPRKNPQIVKEIPKKDTVPLLIKTITPKEKYLNHLYLEDKAQVISIV